MFGLLMIVASLLVVAAGAEGLVRLLVPKEVFWPISNIYRPVEVPGVGYTFRPDFVGTAFGVGLETNDDGFRGPQWSREPDADTLRIALIGDSIAFGFGVAYDETVGEHLARLLEARLARRVEVLNFGVNGHNAGQQRAVLEHFALPYAPDVVVILTANNDFKPALFADQDGWLHWDGSDDVETRMRDHAIARDEPKAEAPWWRHSRLVRYAKLFLARRAALSGAAETTEGALGDIETAPTTGWMVDPPPAPVPEHLRASVHRPLLDMISRTRADGGRVVMAAFCGTTDMRQLVRTVAQENDVAMVELFKHFPEATHWQSFVEQFSLGWDSHPNALAHARMARAVADEVAKVVGGDGTTH